jgi:hypothetical protein
MKHGRWKLVGDAIQFNTQGELINGQHRLTAIVESNVTCLMVVMENCDDRAKAVIDLGRARTVPDTLRMIYGIERANLVTGAMRAIDLFVHGRKLRLTVGHALDHLRHYGEAFNWITNAMPGNSKFSSAAVVGPLVYAHGVAPPAVEEFARQLFVGDELKADSPVLRCRNYILERGGTGRGREERRHIFLLVLTAIRYHLENRRTRSAKVDPDIIRSFLNAHARGQARTLAA